MSDLRVHKCGRKTQCDGNTLATHKVADNFPAAKRYERDLYLCDACAELWNMDAPPGRKARAIHLKRKSLLPRGGEPARGASDPETALWPRRIGDEMTRSQDHPSCRLARLDLRVNGQVSARVERSVPRSRWAWFVGTRDDLETETRNKMTTTACDLPTRADLLMAEVEHLWRGNALEQHAEAGPFLLTAGQVSCAPLGWFYSIQIDEHSYGGGVHRTSLEEAKRDALIDLVEAILDRVESRTFAFDKTEVEIDPLLDLIFDGDYPLGTLLGIFGLEKHQSLNIDGVGTLVRTV